ncbi:MAG TPA: hypothetical protein VLE02_01660 [Nitrosarchaeum sp.]|nr:hypothetical protein [Nitrosarchaeum sp.]
MPINFLTIAREPYPLTRDTQIAYEYAEYDYVYMIPDGRKVVTVKIPHHTNITIKRGDHIQLCNQDGRCFQIADVHDVVGNYVILHITPRSGNLGNQIPYKGYLTKVR